MPNIGPLEIAIVLIIVLIIFGPKKLPELGRSLGSSIREFKGGIGGGGDDDEGEQDRKAGREEASRERHLGAELDFADRRRQAPAATVISGRSRLTTEFAPTTQRSPIRTPLVTTTPAASQQLEPISTGPFEVKPCQVIGSSGSS